MLYISFKYISSRITLVHEYCWYATHIPSYILVACQFFLKNPSWIQSFLKSTTYKTFLISRHGNHKVFSCRGIELCINHFKRKGHTEITAFVPQWRTRSPQQNKPIKDQHILEELRDQGMLTYTPARRVGGKTITCYDDRYV